MFIVSCLPFSKGWNKGILSYFSPEYLEPGSLLKISIRNKKVSALVLESRDAREAKSEIRSANFQIKKVSSVVAKPFLQREFLETIKECSQYFATTEGGVLSHLIPSLILNNPNLLQLPRAALWDISKNTFGKESEEDTNKKIKNQTAILQTGDEERFVYYRSIIRESFAKKKSVFLCLPQNEEVREAKEQLERGIESFVYAFHKDMSQKSLKQNWKEACLSRHPVLIIATAKWLFLPRDDFDTIIIDKENGNGWRTLSRPFIDLRFFAEALARYKNIRAILGDSFLRIETSYRCKWGEIEEFERVKWRLPPEIEISVVDLRETTKKEKEFKAVSPEMLDLIKRVARKKSNVFIFASRKGLASATICRDCGEVVRCFNCSSVMVLYKKARLDRGTGVQSIFRCHQCGEERNAAELCQNCKSWRLEAFGSGIDRIAQEINGEIKKGLDIKLFEISKDTISTSVKAQKIIQSFYENRGSILLGTEMAFPYLHKKVSYTAIASFDSLFFIPDFRIREKIFRIILQTQNLAKNKFLIQSRNPEDSTIGFAIKGNLADFYEKEMEDRKTLSYPPFSIFIKVTVRGPVGFVSRETPKLEKILRDYKPTIFSSVHEKKGQQAATNAVIKLPARHASQGDAGGPCSEWPHLKLLSLLKSLPPHFEIKVDPDNLL